MNAARLRACFVLTVALALAVQPAGGRAGMAQYGSMAPLAQYLTARQAEIDLARSAAPKSISDKATVLVFTSHGYVTAVRGTNGFTCMVERSWTKAFDDDNYWNPNVRAPVCYNAPASRTVVPYTIFSTKLALKGASEEAIHQQLIAAVANKQLPLPENGSVGYMMSKAGYIDDHVKAWHPHVMIYTPKALGANGGESWGANEDGSPVVYDSNHKLWPQPWALFFIPVAHWSDGSPGPSM